MWEELVLGVVLGGVIGIVSSYCTLKWQYKHSKQALVDQKVLELKIEIYNEFLDISCDFLVECGKAIQLFLNGNAEAANTKMNNLGFGLSRFAKNFSRLSVYAPNKILHVASETYGNLVILKLSINNIIEDSTKEGKTKIPKLTTLKESLKWFKSLEKFASMIRADVGADSVNFQELPIKSTVESIKKDILKKSKNYQ